MLKKQFTALFFILIMTIPLANAIGLFVSHWQVKLELVSRLQHNNVHTISILKNQLVWVEENKELLLHNQLFDVKKVLSETAESITVAGLFDDEEDAIWKKVEHANHPFSKKQHLISCFFKQQLTVQPTINFEFSAYKKMGTQKYNFKSQLLLLNLVFDKDKPPCLI